MDAYNAESCAGAKEEFATPALLVDLDVFEANVASMSSLLRGTGKTVRPHFKTHRTPELAKRELGRDVRGATCATVGEAEVVVCAGIDDVLIANEIVSASKITRVVALAHRAVVQIAADDREPLEVLSREAALAGVTVGVLIDVDIRLRRCGVGSPDAALALAELIDRLPGLELAGLMGYEGRISQAVAERESVVATAYSTLAHFKEAFLTAGFPVRIVSAGGTSTLHEALADPTITEVQAGVYALMEPELLGGGLPFRCAVHVRGTVISRHPDRVVVDVGRRVVGTEYGPPVPVDFEAEQIVVNDEHTVITGMRPAAPLGGAVDLIPRQIRTTFNLHDRVWLTRAGTVGGCWPVSARGRSQ